MINILALDPSQKNLGMAYIEFDPRLMRLTPLDLRLVTTEKDSNKVVRKNSDDIRRARSQAFYLKEGESWADIVMTEVPTGSQSASGMFSNGVCVGLIAMISKPVIEVQPMQTKLAAIGTKTATKLEMIEWATKLYPVLPWIRANGKPNGKIVLANEHLADALGVAHAGIITTEFKAVMKMFNAMQPQPQTA